MILNISTVFSEMSKKYEDKTIKIKNLVSQNVQSANTGGILTKWSFELNDKIYYVKAGEKDHFGNYTNLQPYSEIMCYRLSRQLGFTNVIETDIAEVCNDDQYFIVSYTTSFLGNEESYRHMFSMIDENLLNSVDLHSNILEIFPSYRSFLSTMLLFDFIVLNVDRHFKNFGFIESEEGNIKEAPIFDNGLSLLANFSELELSGVPIYKIDKELTVKPFNTKPYRQFKKIDKDLIDNDLLNNIYYSEINWEEIFKDINISNLRKRYIRELVEIRIDYVRRKFI